MFLKRIKNYKRNFSIVKTNYKRNTITYTPICLASTSLATSIFICKDPYRSCNYSSEQQYFFPKVIVKGTKCTKKQKFLELNSEIIIRVIVSVPKFNYVTG